MNVQVSPMPDEDTVAAALAALERFLADDAPAAARPAAPRQAWRTAGKLAAQGLPAARTTTERWASADRSSREQRWSYGVVGI